MIRPLFAAMMLVATIPSANASWWDQLVFEVPTSCKSVTTSHLNATFSNAELSVKALVIRNARDTGSTANGLQCSLDVLSSIGEIRVSVTTERVKGEPYMKTMYWPN
jgi:hypothetical protein